MRLLLLLVLVGSALVAQTGPPTLEELFNLPVVSRVQPQPAVQAEVATKIFFVLPNFGTGLAAQPCAIPLRNARRTDPHDRMKIAPGRGKGTILEFKPPAPSCDDKK